MIRALAKVMLGMAVIAITIGTAATSQAETPQGVFPAGGLQTDVSSVEQVSHEEEVQKQDCTDQNCLHCGGRFGVCDGSGYCERCRRGGLLRWLWPFGPNCRSHGGRVVRGGACRGHGMHGGHGRGPGQGGAGGRFLPSGCGGKGCPPFGTYQMVYPVNPDHFDGRDGQVHAAQGYGVPVAVPLPPVVRQQYNYSWGVPASRITHISNHAPHYLQGGPAYGYPGQMQGYSGPMGPGIPPGGYPHGYCPECEANRGR